MLKINILTLKMKMLHEFFYSYFIITSENALFMTYAPRYTTEGIKY